MNGERPLAPAERKAWRTLYEAHGRVTQRIEHDLAIAGVGSLSDYGVLFTISTAPDSRVRLSELADAAMLSRSGITRLVSRLEGDGFLRREPCESDKRGTFAVLTGEGRSEMRRIWAVYSSGISRYFAACLSPADADALAAILRQVKQQCHADAPAPDPC